MTDENPPGGTSPPKEPEPKNKAVKISMDEAYALLDTQKVEIENLKKLNGDLTVQLDEANKVLEGQEKAKLISEVLPS